MPYLVCSAVFSGGAGGARAPLEFGGSQKGRSLISAYQSLAITTDTPGFEKLNTALVCALFDLCPFWFVPYLVCAVFDSYPFCFVPYLARAVFDSCP